MLHIIAYKFEEIVHIFINIDNGSNNFSHINTDYINNTTIHIICNNISDFHLNCNCQTEKYKVRKEMVQCAFDIVFMFPMMEQQQQQQQQFNTEITSEMETRVSSIMILCKTCAKKSFIPFVCTGHCHHNLPIIILGKSPTSSIQESDDVKDISIISSNNNQGNSSSVINITNKFYTRILFKIELKNLIKNNDFIKFKLQNYFSNVFNNFIKTNSGKCETIILKDCVKSFCIENSQKCRKNKKYVVGQFGDSNTSLSIYFNKINNYNHNNSTNFRKYNKYIKYTNNVKINDKEYKNSGKKFTNNINKGLSVTKTYRENFKTNKKDLSLLQTKQLANNNIDKQNYNKKIKFEASNRLKRLELCYKNLINCSTLNKQLQKNCKKNPQNTDYNIRKAKDNFLTDFTNLKLDKYFNQLKWYDNFLLKNLNYLQKFNNNLLETFIVKNINHFCSDYFRYSCHKSELFSNLAKTNVNRDNSKNDKSFKVCNYNNSNELFLKNKKINTIEKSNINDEIKIEFKNNDNNNFKENHHKLKIKSSSDKSEINTNYNGGLLCQIFCYHNHNRPQQIVSLREITSEFNASSFHDDTLKGILILPAEIECYDELNSNSSTEDNIREDLSESELSLLNYDKSYIYSFDEIQISDNYFSNNDNKDELFIEKMREISGGPLRGLLKKPNRPPATRKNRVVFDETRNEFFEADYIILIREDCAYDEEDEEPCTCGEHELVRLCCEEGCQCNYTDEKQKVSQNSKFTPPIEFVDEAALSPPEGYKDGLKNTLGGAFGGHVFGAQHIQQLQVIQRLQQQRAAMLAARASIQQHQQSDQASVTRDEHQAICTECVECVECAAKEMEEKVDCDDDVAQLTVPTVALVPVHNNSPERRVTQKEIIAGEERPKYILGNQHKSAQVATTTEKRVVREAIAENTTPMTTTSSTMESERLPNKIPASSQSLISLEKPTVVNQSKAESIATNISGILKGGKLWKNDQTQVDENNIPSSEEEGNMKRSVRFITENSGDDQRSTQEDKEINEIEETEQQINEYVPFKHKHSSIFNNALRPNSALRQLFPSIIHPPSPASILTHETLRAFDESKRSVTSLPNLLAATSDCDTIRRTIERNVLRRSLIKKKSVKSDLTLEERIKQLTCNIDDTSDENRNGNKAENNNVNYHANEGDKQNNSSNTDNTQHASKYIPDKNFSPSSSASSSSSSSTTAHRRATDVLNRENQSKHEKFSEQDEAPIVIIPQECRCPAAPDLGMGVQVPAVHTQIHQTPPRQSDTRRQFLSTLSPLTACVAGQKDDLSYYTLAPGDRNSTASSQCSEYSSGEVEGVLFNDESRKVAPDVIAGTPGQEQDELETFAQQEANRTEKLKKRYSSETHNHTNISSDDDEQNDYGFNKRPTVRGIKPKFSSTNEILQQMQAQLNQIPAPQQLNTSNTLKTYNHSYQEGNVNRTQDQNTITRQHQKDRTWAYYPEIDQRCREEQLCEQSNHQNQKLPGVLRHTFHGREESLMYQNCQNITMEHHYAGYAKSPTRRPESPPPLRNYHQTMVLIPYNASEPLTHLSKTEHHQFHHQNILEYQQVTQQTIRVPISYALPGMQLHVIAGRGTHHQATAHYIQHQHPTVISPRGYVFRQDSVSYTDRATQDETAPIISQQQQQHSTDCKGLLSPTSVQNENQQNYVQTSQSSTSISTPDTVFYAMNV